MNNDNNSNNSNDKILQTEVTENTVEAGSFICLQPEEFQQLYKVYVDAVSSHSSKDVIKQKILQCIKEQYGFSASQSALIAKAVLERFLSPQFHVQFYDTPLRVSVRDNLIEPSQQEPMITISSVDYERYVELVSADHESDINLKALLLSFVIFYRKNYHPRGWAKYDKKNIFFLAGVSNLPIYLQEKLTNRLHTHYNLDMQVIGSNQPSPCFMLPWLYDQPTPGGAVNPMITLGPLKPSTLRDIINKLQ